MLAADAGEGPTSAPGELDILAMVEAWVQDVGQLQGYLNMLAGLSESNQQHQLAGAAVSADSRVTPLLATSAASSHAPHLYAQLGVHSSCLEGIKSLKASLSSHMAAAGKMAFL
jgi:hypothetical protein